jgi:hypothetical protein
LEAAPFDAGEVELEGQPDGGEGARAPGAEASEAAEADADVGPRVGDGVARILHAEGARSDLGLAQAGSWRLADPAVELRPPCESTSQMGCFFIMVGIVSSVPNEVSWEIVHGPNRDFGADGPYRK